MLSVFHWTGQFKLHIGTLLFVSLYLCQSAADMETNGYYSFEIKTEMDPRSHTGVCRGMEIQFSNVISLVLDGQEMQTFSCECSIITDRNGHKLEPTTTPILNMYTTGFGADTVYIKANWFRNDNKNEDRSMWKFNVKPEQQKSVVTYNNALDVRSEVTLNNKTTRLTLGRLNQNISLDLKCQGRDNDDITTVLTSSGETMSTTTGGTPSTETREVEGQSTSLITFQSTETTISQNSFFYYIIAAVVGGVLLFFIVIITITIVCIRKRKQRHEDLKIPGSSPAVLYSSLSQSQKNDSSSRKNPIKRQTTVEDDQLVNQSEVVGTTYADIDPTSLVLRDTKTETTPGGDQGQEQGLTYADLDWAGGNGKQPAKNTHDPRDQLYAKPQKRGH